jgi:hypothetical protein
MQDVEISTEEVAEVWHSLDKEVQQAITIAILAMRIRKQEDTVVRLQSFVDGARLSNDAPNPGNMAEAMELNGVVLESS